MEGFEKVSLPEEHKIVCWTGSNVEEIEKLFDRIDGLDYARIVRGKSISITYKNVDRVINVGEYVAAYVPEITFEIWEDWYKNKEDMYVKKI